VPLVEARELRPRDVEPREGHVAVALPHVELGDRRGRVVTQVVVPGNGELALPGVDRDVKGDFGHHGAREGLVLEILALELGKARLALVRGLVGVEHFDVVVDDEAGAHHPADRGERDACRGQGDAAADALEARQDRDHGAARPGPVRKHQQQHPEAGPIGARDEPADPEAAGPVHVAERLARPCTEHVEHVLVAEVLEEDAAQEPHEHDPPADILVGAEDLEEHREDRDQQEIDALRPDEGGKVQAQIHRLRALGELVEEAGRRARQGHDDEHREDGDDLGHEHRPAGGRGRIDDLVDLHVALAPHELAAVEDGNDQAE